jgi:hypothetical protein
MSYPPKTVARRGVHNTGATQAHCKLLIWLYGKPRPYESENGADAALESLHVLGGGLTG